MVYLPLLLSSLTGSLIFYLNCIACEPLGSICLHYPMLRLQATVIYAQLFHVDSADLNRGPRACPMDTLAYWAFTKRNAMSFGIGLVM